jgi:hypothetical protein
MSLVTWKNVALNNKHYDWTRNTTWKKVEWEVDLEKQIIIYVYMPKSYF